MVEAAAVDWSGRAVGAGRYTWLAAAEGGRVVELRSDVAVVNELARLEPTVVGLDFGFSFPVWFLDELGVADAVELWERVAIDGEDWLAACAAPFWGRPGRPRGDEEQLRATERAVPSTAGVRPKSVFQIGGAGTVGTGSVRGMPLLLALRRAGFSIWPFDDGWPRVVEV